MKALKLGDSSALSLLAESPDETTKRLVFNDLSPEAQKIAEAMVPTKKTVRRKSKGAAVKAGAHVAEDAVQSTADALLRWSK